MPQFLARTLVKQGAFAAALVLLSATPGAADFLDNLNPSSWFAEKYEPTVTPDIPADTIYNEGMAAIRDRHYEGAAKKFDDLEKRYAYSDWSRKALLMTAYSNYQGEKYDDAINASKRYLQRHPATKDAAYAQYLMAMSQYKQIPDVNRDQERAERALQALNELVEKYPSSEYTADARSKIQITRDQLAGKEMEVGRFYLEKRNFPAAINRFREVVAKYQTTRHAEEALARLTEAYMALGITGEAQTAAAVLGHNFPEGQYFREANALLQSGGLQPREERSSWLSKAFRSVTGRTASAN